MYDYQKALDWLAEELYAYQVSATTFGLNDSQREAYEALKTCNYAVMKIKEMEEKKNG